MVGDRRGTGHLYAGGVLADCEDLSEHQNWGKAGPDPVKLGDDVPFEIRAATAADIPALVSLMTDFYAEAEIALPADAAARAFEALFAEPAMGGVWLAHRGGTAVGHVVLAVTFSMEYGGRRGFIDDLYVHPTARGRGRAPPARAAGRDGRLLSCGAAALCARGICGQWPRALDAAARVAAAPRLT